MTLMTLHTAKGLEWPVVVLTGLEHGLFPLARAEEQPDGLEEERRLCYVGLTRAKDKLYLTWARARRRGGELRPGIPSRFLKALPPNIVEEQPDHVAVGAGLGRDGGTARTAGAGGRWRGRRFGGRTRPAVPPSRCPAGGRALTGRSALRQRRAGPPPPLRQRHDPGAERSGSRPQGVRRVRRRGDRCEAAARGLRGPRARMGERMSIGRERGAARGQAGGARGAARPSWTGWWTQMNRIVDYVAQLDQVPADRHGRAVPARTGVRRAPRGRAGPGAARAPAGRARARVPRRLLPGAAPWCHGGAVSGAAAAARETGARLAKADRAGLNATLALVAGSCSTPRRRGWMPWRDRRVRWPRLPIAIKDNIVTIEQPTTCASRILEGYVSPYNATAVDRLARGRGDHRGARPTWTSSRWARPPSTRRSAG